MKTVFLMLCLIPALTWACEPVPPPKDKPLGDQVRDKLDENGAVFIGVVSKIDKKEIETNTHFHIIESFKGDYKDKFETGWVPDCCLCHMHFELNEAYVVYASENRHGMWVVDAYNLSKKFKKMSAEELGYLREYSWLAD